VGTLEQLSPNFTGQIVVYNKNFESLRLDELSTYLPKYRKRIIRIQKRLWDLLAFIREHVYYAEFRGSFS